MSRSGSVSLPVDPKMAPSQSAQSLLHHPSSIVKSGFLKCKDKRFGRWSRRFVIVTNQRIFVYVNEVSKTAHTCIALLGYQGVSRYTSKSKSEAPWAFQLNPSWESLLLHKFSGTSDKERAEWMVAIKTSLFTANCITPPALWDETTRASMRSFETDGYGDPDATYRLLEEPTFELHRPTPEAEEGNDSDEESDCEAFEKPVSNNKYRNRKLPEVNINPRYSSSSFRSSGHSEALSTSGSEPPLYEASDEESEYLKPTESIIRRASEPSFTSRHTHASSICSNPDYQNFREIQDSLLKAEDDVYTTPQETVSLETMCSTVDSQLEREVLIAQLKEKPARTYLIRKSRQDSQNVLAFHCGEEVVKEFKIFQTHDGRLTLDKEEHFFEDIEALLLAYSCRLALPKTNLFLGCGFYHCLYGQ